METEKEKRKIEFWNSSDDIWEAVHDNCTNQKPMQAPVEVAVKIADKYGVYKDLSMSYIVDQIEEANCGCVGPILQCACDIHGHQR